MRLQAKVMHVGLILSIIFGIATSRPIEPPTIKITAFQKFTDNGIRDPKDVIKGCFCPVGHQPRRNCTSRSNVECVRCPPGFYSDAPTFNACRPCQACSKNTFLVAPCTSTHQTICTDAVQLYNVCQDFRPVILPSDNEIHLDVLNEYKTVGPSNAELAVVCLSLLVAAVFLTLLLIIRAKSVMKKKRKEPPVPTNADYFKAAGSIYQTDDLQTPTVQPKETRPKSTLFEDIFSTFGITTDGESVEHDESPTMTVALREPSLTRRQSRHEAYCAPSIKDQMALDDQGFYKDTFDSEGGTLAHKEVAITICKLSIPQGMTYTIRGKTHTQIPEWNSCVEAGEVIIAPPIELHVDGDYVFDEHVTVCIPHCIEDSYSLAAVRVFWGDKSSGKTFNAIPRMVEKRQNAEAFYVADEDHIYIHAKHFNASQFLCTISGSQINLQLQMLVFYEHTVVAETQYLKIKVNLCDSRNNITDLREAYFEHEGLPLIPSCSWHPLELPLGYATPNTEVTIEFIPDEDWNEASYGEMKIPLKVSQKLIHVLNLRSNCLAQYPLKRNLSGRPATQFHGKFVLSTSEKIEERRQHDVYVFNAAGGANRRGYLQSRGGSTYTIETNKSSREELPVIIHLHSQETSTSKAINGKIEDAMAFVAQNLPREYFPKLGRRLGLKEPDMDGLKERYRDDTYEQTLQMLLKWQQKYGKIATVEQLRRALMDIGLTKTAGDLEDHLLHMSLNM